MKIDLSLPKKKSGNKNFRNSNLKATFRNCIGENEEIFLERERERGKVEMKERKQSEEEDLPRQPRLIQKTQN